VVDAGFRTFLRGAPPSLVAAFDGVPQDAETRYTIVLRVRPESAAGSEGSRTASGAEGSAGMAAEDVAFLGQVAGALQRGVVCVNGRAFRHEARARALAAVLNLCATWQDDQRPLADVLQEVRKDYRRLRPPVELRELCFYFYKPVHTTAKEIAGTESFPTLLHPILPNSRAPFQRPRVATLRWCWCSRCRLRAAASTWASFHPAARPSSTPTPRPTARWLG